MLHAGPRMQQSLNPLHPAWCGLHRAHSLWLLAEAVASLGGAGWPKAAPLGGVQLLQPVFLGVEKQRDGEQRC